MAKTLPNTQSTSSRHITRRIAKTKARAVLYQLLSDGFAYPDPVGPLEESRRTAVLAAVEILNDRWLKLCGELLEWSRHADRMLLALEYNRLFAPRQSLHCPPYETVYTCLVSSAVRHSQELADIAGFYRAFGVGINEAAADRPDHLSLELEFMAVLCQKEAYALTKGATEQSGICRDAQQGFLQDHLGCWAGLFAASVQQDAEPGFYCILARLLEEFIESERRTLKAQPSKVASREAPTDGDDRSICGACALEQ